jgi:hypothetical protein
MQLTSQPHQQQIVLSPTNSFLHLSAMIDDRAAKKLAYVTSWENAKKAEMEAELKKIEVGDQVADKSPSLYGNFS